MTYSTFTELYNQLQILFQEKEYPSAIRLATEGLEQFPDRRPVLDYWRITLTARNGDDAGALAVFKDALDHGSWFSEILLRRSPSLETIREDPQFEALLLRNQQIAETDQEAHFPYYILRPEGKCRSGGTPCPLLIGLHTSGGVVQSSIDFWKPAASLGWLVAAPQSSQALMKGAHIWDDREITEQEIKKDYASLIEHYTINPWQTILAGHSSGAETAIWLTLKGSLEVNSFLAIGPTGPFIDDLEEWKDLLTENNRSRLRGYIITGELDEIISHDQTATLVEMLNQAGVETDLEIVSGAEHDYVPDYEPAIRRGLNFLTG